jgi:predicted GH43/DUF377 family glycosyl hydrolase
MWISYCSLEQARADLAATLIWRDHQFLAGPEQPWEALKIGGGTPPVHTPYGWMMVYHGVAGRIIEETDHQPFVHYCAGLMILDHDDPRRVIFRSKTPILEPELAEERSGVVPNVVFPTGVDARNDSRFDIYYGMADAAIGVARLDLL